MVYKLRLYAAAFGIMSLSNGCKTAIDGGDSPLQGIPDKTREQRVDGAYCLSQQGVNLETPGGNTRSSYAIFSVQFRDLIKYQRYFDPAKKLVYKNSGRIVMRGVNFFNVLEGSAPFQAFSIVEFPSRKNFNDFYCSDAYQPDVINLRLESTKINYSVLKDGDLEAAGLDSSSSKNNVKAFAFFNDVVTDQTSYQVYLNEASILAASYGGRRIFSGPQHIELEGFPSDKPDNLTGFVFPNMTKLKQWYASKAYKVLQENRLKASKVVVVLAMDGWVP